MSIKIGGIMEKNEKLGKREEEKRPEGYLLIKTKEYSQELYLVFNVSLGVSFLAIFYTEVGKSRFTFVSLQTS